MDTKSAPVRGGKGWEVKVQNLAQSFLINVHVHYCAVPRRPPFLSQLLTVNRDREELVLGQIDAIGFLAQSVPRVLELRSPFILVCFYSYLLICMCVSYMGVGWGCICATAHVFGGQGQHPRINSLLTSGGTWGLNFDFYDLHMGSSTLPSPFHWLLLPYNLDEGSRSGIEDSLSVTQLNTWALVF